MNVYDIRVSWRQHIVGAEWMCSELWEHVPSLTFLCLLWQNEVSLGEAAWQVLVGRSENLVSGQEKDFSTT